MNSALFRFTLVMTIVCVLAALGVGGVYVLTREPVKQMERRTGEALRRAVLPGATVFESRGDGVCAGLESDNGPFVGYVSVGQAYGYGGLVRVMVGLDNELHIVRVAVLSQNETPGLGAELAKRKTTDTLWSVLAGKPGSAGKSWLDQFAGKSSGQLHVGAGIDAKSGATVTSKAITAAARNAIDRVQGAADAETGATKTNPK
jgi:electron transport complex protein RnfG